MAKITTNTKQWVESDAEFRARIAEVRAILTAAGWVQVTQTGQIDPATVARPAANTKAGFEIWRMADSLQATKPVFGKFSYGTQSTQYHFRVWVQIGMGQDGAGNLTTPTNMQAPSTEINMPMGGSSRTNTDTASYRNYFNGDTGRIVMAFATNVASAPYGNGFFIERTHEAAGAYNGDAVVFGVWVGNQSDSSFSNSYFQVYYYPLETQNIPPLEKRLQFNAPSQAVTALVGNKGYNYPMLPPSPLNRNPLTSLVAYYANDFGAGAAIPLSIYGADKDFMPLGPTQGYADGRNSVLCLAMRYDT